MQVGLSPTPLAYPPSPPFQEVSGRLKKGLGGGEGRRGGPFCCTAGGGLFRKAEINKEVGWVGESPVAWEFCQIY